MKTEERHKANRVAKPKIVAKLQKLVGNDVLFLAWPVGTKGTRRRWKRLTSAKMSDAKYLKRFTSKNINIGIAQGAVSNGLCSIDIDVDNEVETFIGLNPRLATSLRSKGARGCNVWFRAPGDTGYKKDHDTCWREMGRVKSKRFPNDYLRRASLRLRVSADCGGAARGDRH
jgi:hypothetical protein